MTFKDDLDRMLDAAYADLAPPPPAEQLPTITVHKYGAVVTMSLDQMMDAGVITEEQARAQGWTPYVPPPIPWRSRLRWRWQAWRERAGRKVGGWLAGVDLTERDEDW